jgi:hypothetical protein
MGTTCLKCQPSRRILSWWVSLPLHVIRLPVRSSCAQPREAVAIVDEDVIERRWQSGKTHGRGKGVKANVQEH